ncbi:MAG: hypothetical protein ACRCZE_05160 [Candidatus Altimarinota bacterium]
MIIDAIEAALARKELQGWEKTYWLFDLHDTVISSTYHKDKVEEFYPHALEVLRILNDREDVCLILFTSSHEDKIEVYLEKFKGLGIKFEYVNENPEATNSDYANFDRKLYFNVLFDDKAGFHPLKEWKLVRDYLEGLWAN